MSWEKDPLWSKSRVFFEYAFSQPRDEPLFGLWCAFGIELLARAAIASVSPVLLAEPENEQKHILHALGKVTERSPQSIGVTRVLRLCRTLFADKFSEEDSKVVSALVGRRNEELHTGAAAFEQYGASQWLAGFYRACNGLALALGETLESLFGEEEAKIAKETIVENENDVRQRVRSRIANHKAVFDAKPKPERLQLAEKAKNDGEVLAYRHHHVVKCPACGCDATVQGEAFGKAAISHNADGEIEERQPVIPRNFRCTACGLILTGYGELAVADRGGHYKRVTTTPPDEYFQLLDPDQAYFQDFVAEYLADHPGLLHDMTDYDNE